MWDKFHGNTALQLIKGRWTMAVASLYILSCAGTTFLFGIYSGAIKKEMHYNQEMIGTLSFFKDLGANVGIMSGLMNEILPVWMVLTVGALMNLFGYLMIWLAVTHRIAHPPPWQMNLFLCIGANSQTFANTGVVVTVVKNFPQGRGEVLGVIKGWVGLSGAMFTQLYPALYGQDTTGVIFLIGWLPSLVTLIFMFFIRPMTPAYDKHEKRNFCSFLKLALLLAAFLMVVIIVENQFHLPPSAYKTFGASTVMLLISNIVIGIRGENAFMVQAKEHASTKGMIMLQEMFTTSTKKKVEGIKGAEKSVSIEEDDQKPSSSHASNDVILQVGKDSPVESTVPPTKTISSSPSAEEGHRSKRAKVVTKFKVVCKNWPQRGEDFTIPQALVSMDMWILFISLTCGAGATLTAVDNMGQIGESQGYSKVNVSTCVALISIWNFLGRVIAGFVSEILLRRYCFPRTLMLTIVLSLGCIGHLLIAFPAPNTLYFASIMVGLCSGAKLPLFLAIISELFGLKYYATLSTFGSLASPLGSYFLNVRVAGHLYDHEARRQGATRLLLLLLDGPRGGVGGPPPPPPPMHARDLTCMGPHCFRLSFLIVTMVNAFGSLVSSLLVLRTKKFYSQDIYAKFNVKLDNQEYL